MTVIKCTLKNPSVTPIMQDYIDRLMVILPIGMENAIKAKKLKKMLNVKEREFHRITENARLQGLPVCSSKGGKKRGLFKPANKEEWLGYIMRVEREIDSRIAVCEAQKKALSETGLID